MVFLIHGTIFECLVLVPTASKIQPSSPQLTVFSNSKFGQIAIFYDLKLQKYDFKSRCFFDLTWFETSRYFIARCTVLCLFNAGHNFCSYVDVLFLAGHCD